MARRWPETDHAVIPNWVYTDPEIFARELERIFEGAGLALRLPRGGDPEPRRLQAQPARHARGRRRARRRRRDQRAGQPLRPSQHAVLHAPTRHRQGVHLPLPPVDLRPRRQAARRAVPPRLSAARAACRPISAPRSTGSQRLAVTPRGTASCSPASTRRTSRSRTISAPTMLGYFDRVFDGRDARVLGYQRQRIPGNWKLMFENIKDPYHASLLHVFLVTFGLFRVDQQSAVEMDETGRHAVLVSRRGEQEANEATRADARVQAPNFALQRPAPARPGARVPRRRHGGDADAVAQPDRPAAVEHAGDAPDRAARRRHSFDLPGPSSAMPTTRPRCAQRRLRQANLMGPAGLVSIDDSEAMLLSQAGIDANDERECLVEMGGRAARRRAAHGDRDARSAASTSTTAR